MATSERLADDDVVDLLRRYQATGDISHRNAVVEAHVALAIHICGDYADRGVDRDDLIQVATVGLIKAADRFDPDLGVPYAAYASQVINGEIKRWFRDKGWSIRPPRSLIELGTRTKRARVELAQTLQRAPTIPEIAAHLDVDPDDVLAALEASEAYRADSLSRPADDGGVIESPALGHNDEELRRAELREAVASLVATLSEDEQRIVRLRFWEERSQQEIADEVGVSQMQISRVLRRILRQLRTTEGLFDG